MLDNSFDLVYAVTAFHWIPEEYGYRCVYNLLKSGGVFARFTYHAGTDKGRRGLMESAVREKIFEVIFHAIVNNGGIVTVYYIWNWQEKDGDKN